MKKQQQNQGQNPFLKSQSETASRVLLIGAILVYSITLLLLANLALATNSTGALIKVNHRLNGDAFSATGIAVRSVHGNILAVNGTPMTIAGLATIQGVCSVRSDNKTTHSEGSVHHIAQKYAGAQVVVGILSGADAATVSHSAFAKIERAQNIGFISFVGQQPGSTVIIRNLAGGESEQLTALAYFIEYARTVGAPLVIEMMDNDAALSNPLFVQACQQHAESGVQFLGSNSSGAIRLSQSAQQLSFAMYNSQTGQVSDASDFWSLSELEGIETQLLGSDGNIGSFKVHNAQMEVINGSSDIVLVKLIDAEGNLHYFHIGSDQTSFSPVTLINGLPALVGEQRFYPYHSKGAIFNASPVQDRFLALNVQTEIADGRSQPMRLKVENGSNGRLQMSLSEVQSGLNIEIRDMTGCVIYRNRPKEDVKSLQASIDLSAAAGGPYFLDLYSQQFHRSFALLMD
jgi:hypothetical protein